MLDESLDMGRGAFCQYFSLFVAVKKSLLVISIILLYSYPRANLLVLFLIQMFFLMFCVKETPMLTHFNQVQLCVNESMTLLILLFVFVLSLQSNYLENALDLTRQREVMDRINGIGWTILVLVIIAFSLAAAMFVAQVIIYVYNLLNSTEPEATVPRVSQAVEIELQNKQYVE